ncbi:MAG: phosphate acyltransferase PlsX [Ruminiclostridium sp.]|nr:phosphate acyltransferase PlsX [Ruminiclostridium sp.]
MKIILDAMGGDHAPLAPVDGAIQAAEKLGVEVILTGSADAIQSALTQLGRKELPKGVTHVATTQVITMEDNPARAFREKKDSSMTVGLQMLKDGEAEAFVSAGSTGALLSAATLMVKRIRGIRRAAMCPVVPTQAGGFVLIDCGATAECTPEYLMQYAYMGTFYAKRTLGLENPRVGLLNNGAEPTKGLALQQETYQLLRQAHEEGRINFVGNVEGREAILGAVDVLVTDGFTGNIFMKTYEGGLIMFADFMKTMFKSSLASKVGFLTVKDHVAGFKKVFSPDEIGGTAMIGISKPVIKAHGSSNAYAIFNAICRAKEMAESDLIQDITANVEYMRLPNGKAED